MDLVEVEDFLYKRRGRDLQAHRDILWMSFSRRLLLICKYLEYRCLIQEAIKLNNIRL